MRNFLLTLSFIVVLCGLSYASFYVLNREPTEVRTAMEKGDSMMWLRTEFKLTDEQYARIDRLHDDYYVECSVHCALIMEAREEGRGADEVAALESTCERAMEVHCRTVAAAMSMKEGSRYLEIVLPRIAHYNHHQAPDLQVSH